MSAELHRPEQLIERLQRGLIHPEREAHREVEQAGCARKREERASDMER